MNESNNAKTYRIRLTALYVPDKMTGEEELCPPEHANRQEERAFQTRQQAEDYAKDVYGDPRYWKYEVVGDD